MLPDTLLIVSLKMYFSPARTLDYLRAMLDPLNDILPAEHLRQRLLLALIPDFVTIYPCAEILKATSLQSQQQRQPPPLLLGAQDCFWESSGAFTGEVSPQTLRAVGVTLVELGHAERRSLFAESDAQVARKAAAACANGLVPLVCIGELTAPVPVSTGSTAAAAGAGAASSSTISPTSPSSPAVDECAAQIRPVLEAVPADADVIFAYEPVWAIGKPAPAGVDHVARVVAGIRAVIGDCGARQRRSGDVRVLYGGSAGPGLWAQAGMADVVDGMFLGRFAHDIAGLRAVVHEVQQTL